ncbi:MAG: choice-of-anchor P family protein [Catenulispora sp.]
MRSRLLAALATLTLTASVCAAQAARPQPARAATGTADVAYVYDFGAGVNDTAFTGSSIFTNAVTGTVHGSGHTASYNAVNFTDVPVSTVDGTGDGAFAGYDTVLLYEVCDIASHPATLHAVNTFLDNGGKVLIFDGDRCSAATSGGNADYAGFAFPFTTDAPGPKGGLDVSYTFVETSTLTDSIKPGDEPPGDELGDSNVFTGQSGGWCTALQSSNVDGVNPGNVEAYARTINGGLAIWNGEDFWFTDGASPHLKEVFDLALAQAHNPDGLPCTNPPSGIKLDPPTATDDVGTSQVETATVVDSSANPRPGINVTFTVLSGPDAGLTGQAVTDGSGQAHFTVSDTTVPGTDTVQAKFNDGIDHFSNKTVITWVARPTKLTYSGPSGGDFNDPSSIAFTLTDLNNGTPIAGQPVTMQLDSQGACTATTNGSGVASCPVTPNEPAGPVPVSASFAGATGLLPSTGSGTFTVTREETTLTYVGDTHFADGTPATLSALLREDGVTKIGGSRNVQLTLGSGATAQTCTAALTASGAWTCQIPVVNQPLNAGGTVAISGTFTGDAFYLPSSFTATGTLEYYTGRAYGLSAKINLLLAHLNLPPQPDTGPITTAGALSTTTPCTATISGLLISAHTLCPNVTVTLAPGTSTGTSTVQDVTIGIPGLPVIKATAIKALSKTTCTASAGSVTIANLTVGGVAVNTSVGPNTGISLGGLAKLILNEQTPVPGADKGLTVNALHVEVLDGTVDVVVASATSDAHHC